ncbi:MAG: hypothetical protein IT289_05620 [Oligoflexia bacterium]|nr:hypothetical protein [Oligoflexia bacterium]
MTENMKVFGSAISLVILLALSIWGNTQYVSGQSLSYRSPASEWIVEMRSLSSLEDQSTLADHLAESKERSSASIGRPADPFESLRFGLLEGKYAVTLAGEKISEVQFVDNPNTEGRPTAISNRSEFLKEYRKLFDLGSDPEKVDVTVRGTKTTETYRSASADGKNDVLVHITFDDLNRLISLKTETVTHMKYF